MIYVSASAEAEFKRRLDQQSSPQNMIRIGIEAGGCAAWFYTLTPETRVNKDDLTFEHGSFRILTEARLAQWLEGLTIDYSEDLMGGSFRFLNPNAANTCGCSSSFTLDPQDEITEDCTQSSSYGGRSEVDIIKNKMVP